MLFNKFRIPSFANCYNILQLVGLTTCIGDLTMEHLNILRVITIVLFIELPHEFPLKQALNVSMEIL